jgi:hypothetical protein
MALRDIVTPDWLKATHLVGIDLTLDDGTEYPDVHYTHCIESAISEVGSRLGIVLDDVHAFTERVDLLAGDELSYHLTRLRNRPVREVTRAYLQIGDTAPQELPLSWIHVQFPIAGQLQIIPGQQSFSGAAVGFSSYGPGPFLTSRSYAPQFVGFEYRAGIDWDDPAQRDELILRAIGIKASILVLNTAGDLVAGSGLQAYSVSMDGLSTNITTANSSTNAGFGARMIQEAKHLEDVLVALRAKYTGMEVCIL